MTHGRIGSRAWIVAGALVLALLAAASLAGRSAEAHAELAGSEPAAGAQLESAPQVLVLWLSEEIEPDYTSVRLYDSDGSFLELRDTVVGEPGGRRVQATPPALEPGAYTVTFRTLSRVDGHDSTGSFRFEVLGPGGTSTGTTAFEPDLGSDIDVTAVAGRALVWIGLSIALGGGAVVFLVSRTAGRAAPSFATGARALYAKVATVTLALALGGVVLVLLAQRDAVGGSLGDLALDTRFGRFWLLRGALVGVALGLASTLAGRDDRRGTFAIGGVLLLTLGGSVAGVPVAHAAAAPGRGWAQLASGVHVATATLWAGGVAFLALLALRRRGWPLAGPPELLLRVLSTFSKAAAVTVGLLVLAGLLRTAGEIPTWSGLDTDYGGWLLLKLAFTSPLLGLAWLNRSSLQDWRRGRRSPDAALARLRAALPFEALTLLLVFVAAIVLAQEASPRALAGGAGEGDPWASPVPQLAVQAAFGAGLALAAAILLVVSANPRVTRSLGRWPMGTAVGLMAAGIALVAMADSGATVAARDATTPESVAAADVDCSALEAGAYLVGCDLSGRDLSGMKLNGVNLTRASLAGANLTLARLSGATLLDADLTEANLEAAYLDSAMLVGARLAGANLHGANFASAALDGADMRGAYLTGADFAHASLVGAQLDGADIVNATFSYATLDGATWTDTACPQGPEPIPGGVELCVEGAGEP